MMKKKAARPSPKARRPPVVAEERGRNLNGGAGIYDVAEQANVSVVTVSRVFNNRPHVSAQMRERVLAAARRVGYTPRLVTKRSVAGIVIEKLEHLEGGGCMSRMLLHLVREASRAGYLAEFIPTESIQLATEHLVDGLIAVGLEEKSLDRLTNLPGVPRVLVNMKTGRPGWHAVHADHADETRTAIQHVRGLGHTRVVLVVDEDCRWCSKARIEAFRSSLGNSSTPLVLQAARMGPRDIAEQIVGSKCTAAMILAEHAGLSIIDALTNEYDIRVPNDLSVIGVENDAVTPYLQPRLTTMEQPLRQMAESAISMLSIDGASRRVETSLPCRLIERSSVRPL